MPAITTEFHPEKFEDAIERHGQYLRWYSSAPCFCVDELTRVDPACKKCLGRGHLYNPVAKRRRTEVGISFGSSTLTTKYNISSIQRLYQGNNTDIPYTSFSGKNITLPNKLNKGIYYHIDYTEDLTESFTGTALWLGKGLIRANLTPVSTIYGDFVGKIISVTSVTNNTKGKTMPVRSFWEDRILTDGYADVGDSITVVCTYVKPTKLLINKISQKDKDHGNDIFQTADGSCSYPGYLDIGIGDVFTLLKATQQTSVIANFTGGDSHQLPFFHVNSILSVEDKRGLITDYSLVRENEIQFNSRTPEDKFSVKLTYNITFVVMGEAPFPRYAEDKVLPKKVALKRWGMGGRSENRPVQTSGHEMEGVLY